MSTQLDQLLQTAIQYHQQGQIHEADKHYRMVLEQDRSNVDMLHFYGLLQFQHGNKVEGLAMMELAVHLKPDYFDAHNNLGNVLVKEGRLEDAADHFHQCCQLNPTVAGPLVNLGTVLKKQGDIPGAIQSCLKALQLEPQHPIAYVSLVDLYTIDKDYNAALNMLDKTLELGIHGAPEQRENYYKSRGALLNLLGRTEDAKALYAEFFKHFPDNAVARHMSVALATDRENQNIPAKPDDEFIRQTFDNFAENFDQVLYRLDYKAPELVGNLVSERFNAGSAELKVLDAGCGTGLCGSYLRSCARLLVGIDLSAGMLNKARLTDDYDELYEAEIEAFLADHTNAYHLIVSADTYCYFGALESLCERMAGSLLPNGSVVFTVETTDKIIDGGYCLQSNGRYQHSAAYVRSVLSKTGFTQAEIENVVLRTERSRPVNGLLVIASRNV